MIIKVAVLKDQVSKQLSVFPAVLTPPGGTLLHQGHDLQGSRLKPTNLLLQGTGSFDATG